MATEDTADGPVQEMELSQQERQGLNADVEADGNGNGDVKRRGSNSSTKPGASGGIRSSPNFVIFCIFIAMLIDSLLVTVMEPLLPDIVRGVLGPDCPQEVNVENSTRLDVTVVNSGNASTTHKCPQGEEETYEQYGTYIGILAAAKPAPEIVFNLIVGHVVDRFGQRFLMVLGCFINAAVTVGFAFAQHYGLLVAIRVVQALASSLTIISAMALFATSFPSEEELAKAAGIASSGLALGSIIGWPLSTFTYQFISKYAPFLILAGLCLLDAALRLFIKQKNCASDLTNQLKPGKFLRVLFTDYQIVIALATVFLYCYSISFFSALGPAWMLDRFKVELWQIGVLWGTAVFYQILIQVTTGILAVKCNRWKFFCIGFICYSICFFIYPFIGVIWQGFGAEALGRIGHAFILGMSFPHFKVVTERRMNMSYGARFGVFTAVYNAGLLAGPLIGGAMLNVVSFEWLCWGAAIVLMCFATVFPISECFKRKEADAQIPVPAPELNGANGINFGSSLIHSGTLC